MKILFNNSEIQNAVTQIANTISEKHFNDPKPPVMICVLNGSFMFFSDLVQALNIDCEIDFIRAKSHVGKESYHVHILKSIEVSIQGKDIYLVDDILDSGKTLLKLKSHLEVFKPKSINFVTLFKKHTSNIESISGITLYNEKWLFGYGMDNVNGLMRNRTSVFGSSEEEE